MNDTHLDTPIGKAGKIRTFTGRLVNPWALQSQDIQIQDIAHSLSQQCRFTGHTARFYSIAEHCLLVASLLARDSQPDKTILGGLVHDAAEAYFGDMAGPSKRRTEMGEYNTAEHQAARLITFKFVGALTFSENFLIKQADGEAYHIERKQLMRPGLMEPCVVDPTAQQLGTMTMDTIEGCYLSLFNQLTRNITKGS